MSGNLWIGTYLGLAKFNGTIFSIYNSSNSNLPSDFIFSILIDDSNNKWIGTSEGLAKFDGSSWTVFNTANSGLPYNSIRSLALDTFGRLWIGLYGALVKFDGSTWTVYDESNSNIPLNLGVTSIDTDAYNSVWMGTVFGGLADFNGIDYWTVYNEFNSNLPNNDVNAVLIDANNNKWIGTGNGLAVFNEGGVVITHIDNKNSALPEDFSLEQNYPNPFNPITKIKYSIPSQTFVTIKIYDLLGKELESLVNEEKPAGSYELNFNAENLSSGVYFYRLITNKFIETKKLILLK
jgi:ligand-binding sensor domain-containing protein